MVAGLDGNAASHKVLLTRLSGHLRGYFKGQLARTDRGAVDAEDLVQEVLIAIHTHRHTYDRSQLFTPWMYAIARYKFLDYLRRTKETARHAPIEEEAEEVAARDDQATVESTLDLDRLLATLSPKARRAIQYVKLDGLSVSDAAARCGMSESAVKITIHRALKALGRQISEREA